MTYGDNKKEQKKLQDTNKRKRKTIFLKKLNYYLQDLKQEYNKRFLLADASIESFSFFFFFFIFFILIFLHNLRIFFIM